MQRSSAGQQPFAQFAERDVRFTRDPVVSECDDLLLIGLVGDMPLDLGRIRRRYEGDAALREDLKRVRIYDWPNVLGQFMLEEPGLGRLVKDARLNTDDRLPLEFSAPRTLYRQTAAQNRAQLRRFRTAAFPEVTPESRAELERAQVRFGIAMGFSGQSLPEEALDQLHEALRLDPRHTPSLFWAGALSLQGGKPAEALGLLRRLQDVDPGNAKGYLLAGQAALGLDKPRDAVTYLERAVTLEPGNQDFRAALSRARQAAAAAP